MVQIFKGSPKSEFPVNCRELQLDIDPKHTLSGEIIVKSWPRRIF